MKIGHILETKGYVIHSVEAEASLTDAVKKMMEHTIGSLVVIDKGKPASIVTERDVLNTVDSSLPRFAELKVRDVMANKLVTCSSDVSISEAMNLMTDNVTGRRIRHLPVIDNGELIGLVSIGDIVHALLHEMKFENKLLKNYIRNWPEEETREV